MVLPKNVQLPHGYTMQNVTEIKAVTNSNIILCKLKKGRILVLKPYGLHNKYPCDYLWRGTFSNYIYELTRVELQKIEDTVNNL